MCVCVCVVFSALDQLDSNRIPVLLSVLRALLSAIARWGAQLQDALQSEVKRQSHPNVDKSSRQRNSTDEKRAERDSDDESSADENGRAGEENAEEGLHEMTPEIPPHYKLAGEVLLI